MRLQIAAALLLTATTVTHSETETFKSGYTAGSPAAPGESVYSSQPASELYGLRDASLADDYAYQQVAHLSENIGPRASGSAQAGSAVQYFAVELR